ncbi:MAG TPA: peptidoglycan-binding protein [Xanthobacteraceae bacterium]|nr:peptidoglycan-binding protein [Xanthobacteraceae bacterium]
MQHPFESLEGEYESLLARMQVTRQSEVDFVAKKLMNFVTQGRYKEVSDKLQIPQIFIATSFERESSSDFRCSPAQGDRWDRVSVNVPKGRGPFPNWTAAAIDAYTLDHLDKVGAANWTWARFCYEGELFNGFGYRSHGVHTPYLWAGSNNYTSGKYVSDGKFSASHVDTQLGTVPVARAMAQMDKTLDLSGTPPPPDTRTPVPTPQPAPIGIGTGTAWVQESLNKLGIADPPLVVDGNSGRLTRAAVEAFQKKAGIAADGLVGPETIAAIEKALG